MPKALSKTDIMATLSKAAEIIRQSGEIDVGSLSFMLGKSVSWINNYRFLLLKMFSDITFEHGRFKALRPEYEALPLHLREEKGENGDK